MTRRRTKSGIRPYVLEDKVRCDSFVCPGSRGEGEEITYPIKEVISFLKNSVDYGVHSIEK